VLDIGSGTGLLAREMAAGAGTVGSVDGVDPSESMLALARRRPSRWGRRDPVRRRRRLRASLRGRVLAAWDEHLVEPYLPRRLTRLLSDARFSLARREAIPLLNAGYDSNTFSAGLMGFIAKFVAGRQGLTEADAQAWAQDLTALGDDYFFSLNRYLFLAMR
jgi:SAM-dependent methyltransferase